ncbi:MULTISPECIES: nucleoside recognition domain-containing protein [unclassified Paenibacillus]|uniref:nucleoside recognition domain-containing protein n=1 Tax=unclassified Paenibacillus TaxID=185978 RepID=UPI001AE309E0|nr:MULTISPECIES: nucleoside recognition domain-containing protein [unclassified Paenibacillus]MBP1156057.1 sporulation integral membrane protein YlbJ [Paenibacillus sp. PvP091]MBP1168557.1 sporulation integral membrane protein YlbJ [Paenibacillus sp. PvR098]MBP2439585.1 sporulation integral membrane protein YlbJ [Paenibacillus sp. PvP052]
MKAKALQALLSPRLTTLFLGAAALALVISIILFPAQAFQASLQGLNLWWKLVFPALLPFLIVTELLRGMGVLHGLGALMEPLLRILLRLPGIGGWVLSLGFTAGMPAGAAAVGTLRTDGLLTREEGERLLAVSHISSPVFMVSVVGVGFLGSPAAGLSLAIIHYTAALLMAVLHRFDAGRHASVKKYARKGWLSHSFQAFYEAKARDGRTFGKLLGDAVFFGVQQLFIIGGCMMMFSVMIHALSLSGLQEALASAVSLLGTRSNDALSLVSALITGFFEPHLGAYAMAQAASASHSSFFYALLSLMLAWGGLSTHAQVKSLTASTDLRYSRFVLSRIHHGGIAFVLTLLSWKPLIGWTSQEQPVLANYRAASSSWSDGNSSLWPFISPMMLQFGTIILILLVLSVFSAFLFYRGRQRHGPL